MPFAPAKRSEIPPFRVMDVLTQAADLEAQGRHIVHVEIGQPGTPAPRLARDAAKAAIDDDVLGYTLTFGISALRERLARHYQDWYGLNIPVERIAVTTGSSSAFNLAFRQRFRSATGCYSQTPAILATATYCRLKDAKSSVYPRARRRTTR